MAYWKSSETRETCGLQNAWISLKNTIGQSSLKFTVPRNFSGKHLWLLCSEMVIHTDPGGPGSVPLNETTEQKAMFYENNRRTNMWKV